MKKYLIVLIAVFGLQASAQVKGNGNIVKRNIECEPIESIEISLYADILIDAAMESKMIISAENNLFDLIDTEVVGGKLKLDQKKWIQPSTRIKIVIGVPDLKRIELGTNDKVRVINLNRDSFSATALNGTIILEGKSKSLNINAENGTVDARSLSTSSIYLNIWDTGKGLINTADYLEAKLSSEAQLQIEKTPAKVKGNISKALANYNASSTKDVRYISFKIRNNSANRQNFYVIGPKPDGNKFSYGFPMMPGAIRKEKWTTGTKVYKVSGLGLKKLLVTITEKDEEQTVNLF